MEIGKTNYPKEYLDSIKNSAFKRMDAKEYGGNGDGKISTEEAYNSLNINSLFSNQKKGSEEYNKLKIYAGKIPETIKKYAGDDEEFSAEEWAQFINGDEWGQVLDIYHSSSGRAIQEMKWIDEAGIQDGSTTKGEIKVGIFNKLANTGKNIDTSEIELIIDDYAGDDGTFTVEEYMALKEDAEFKAFLEEHGIQPY